MKAILNVIWLLFGGIWLALGYALAGIVCCLLIVTIPFGIASFRIASYALWPFGRTVIDSGRGTGVLATLGNVIWLVIAGVWIAIGHILTAIPMFVSIIGIPLGIANLKMIPISLLPLGKRIVPTSGPGLVPYNSPTPYATYSGAAGKGRYGR
ncbi:YccF domain-containing protein [Arthrobacter sp.]|uniref:YccF domain-containing protein n=1 Tax=Arthrobacter sp. TaxID=1667 RepID=UPI0028A23175|nr:YccF domain-containing protein [Arthrobacter sp.]